MIKPSKKKIELWNKLVREVFNHPKSKYSIFVYEMLKRRILGNDKEEYRTKVISDERGYGKIVYDSDNEYGILNSGTEVKHG